MVLGTFEELPPEYRAALGEAHTTPLWPMMRNVLPHGRPHAITKPHLWSFSAIRPLLLRAGELTPVEKAERRVLVLCDPGRGEGAMQATSTIYLGLQLLLPGETAPAHRHTPSAARIVVEGEGAYTVVDGEKCRMEPGDVILTPGGTWHDHGHAGAAPVIWLDALDLPLFVYLEGSYAEEGFLQRAAHRVESALAEYSQAGLVPRRPYHQAPKSYPMLRYPFERTVKALEALDAVSTPREPLEVDYVNPETGQSCLPTLGFTAMRLRTGERQASPLRSSSAAFHVVQGNGRSTVDGREFTWDAGDTFSAPPFSRVEHEAHGSHAHLIRVHDRPLQEKLGFYEERPSGR
jgi:gentisate 1,2-dioxygenase